MIQRYRWSKCGMALLEEEKYRITGTPIYDAFIIEADHLAALRRVREKVDKAHVYSDTEDADGVFDMLGKNEILAIIDEEIKEAGHE
jgi:hypothetical protein